MKEEKFLIELLTDENENIRISNTNGKWMYFNTYNESWEVRIQEYKKRNTTLLVSTKNLKNAIEEFKKGY